MAPHTGKNIAMVEAQVVACAEDFSPDEIDGFEKATLKISSGSDGELAATLVRTVRPEQDSRPAVLYVHGFVDYFFHAHVAKAFEEAGFRFYAIDLRRHGRSLRPGNLACVTESVDDYFVELDWAVASIHALHPELSGIVAHSTGGLVTALYLDKRQNWNTRRNKAITQRLVLNSPFLQFNFGWWDLVQARLVTKLANILPYFPLPHRLNPVYGMTIHKSTGGEWDYDLKKKPLGGFVLFPSWFRMIGDAHTRLGNGLTVNVPILCMHSARSRRPGKTPQEADRQGDIVLNVDHIKSLSQKLGPDVTLFEVPDGVHDLTLSKREARELAISKMVQFISESRTEGTPT